MALRSGRSEPCRLRQTYDGLKSVVPVVRGRTKLKLSTGLACDRRSLGRGPTLPLASSPEEALREVFQDVLADCRAGIATWMLLSSAIPTRTGSAWLPCKRA